MSHRRAALYLQIPAAYCRSFGGLRWAQYGEAVEFLDGPDAGRTFAFAAEIGQFLEGLLVPGRPCPAFGSVLHLLYLIGLGDRAGTSDWPVDRIRRVAWSESPRRSASWGVRSAMPGRSAPGSAARSAGRRRSARAPRRPRVAQRRELDPADGPQPPDARRHGLRRAARRSTRRMLEARMHGELLDAVGRGDPALAEVRPGPASRAATTISVPPPAGRRGRLAGGPRAEAAARGHGPAGRAGWRGAQPAAPPARGHRTAGRRLLGPDDPRVARADPADPVRARGRGVPPPVRRARAALLPPRDAAAAPRRTSSSCCSIRGCAPGATSGSCWPARRWPWPGRPRAASSTSSSSTTGDAGDPAAPDAEAIGDLLESSDLSPNPARTLARLLRGPRLPPRRRPADPPAQPGRAGGRRGGIAGPGPRTGPGSSRSRSTPAARSSWPS